MRNVKSSRVFYKLVSLLLTLIIAAAMVQPAYALVTDSPKYGLTPSEYSALTAEEKQERKEYWYTLNSDEQLRLSTEARERMKEEERLLREQRRKEYDERRQINDEKLASWLEEMARLREEADEEARLEEETVTEEEADGNLPLNEEQAEPILELGFSTDQPERYSPSGELVDRTQSPFGVNKVTKFGVNQLFVNHTIQNTLYGPSFRQNDTWKYATTPLIRSALDNGGTNLELNTAGERVSVPADIDGDGKDEVVTVFYNAANNGLGLALTQYLPYSDERRPDYTHKVVTKTYAQIGRNSDGFFQGSIPGVNDKVKNTYAAAGDFDRDGTDEIAIGRGTTIVICRVTAESLTVLSSLELSDRSEVFRELTAQGAFGSSRKSLLVNSILAADLDDDGFEELFVTAGRSYISLSAEDTDEDINDYEQGVRSFLMIFRRTTDLSTLSQQPVDLSANVGNNSVYIDNPGMDIGDIFGDGEKELVIGGRLFGRKDDNNVGLATIHYDPDSDSYQTGLSDNRIYTFVTNDFKAVQNKLGLKCVNFNPAAFMHYVVLGGFIYKYNAENDVFDKQTVTAVNTSNLKINSEAKAKNSLTNVNTSKDKTYILDMVSANFNEASLQNMGNDISEQLVVLHHNEWYDSRRIYVTTVSMTNGELYAYMEQRFNNKNNGYYESICAPDIYDRGLQMEFLPGESEFIFSDPMIAAILAATPFYKELEDEYEGLGNAKTLFGTEKSKTSSQSHGLSVSASFVFGHEFELSIAGTVLAESSWEMEISNEFTATFEKYSSVTKHILYENYYNSNAVVVTAIPYDCYTFRVTNTETGETEDTKIMVPFSPVTRIMSYNAYNKVAKNLSSVPDVTGVFTHTIGDPRSYPRNKSGLSNVEDAEILLGMSGDDYGTFVGVGIGNNVTEQEIDITLGKARTLENKFEVKFSMTAGGGGFYVGGGAGLGYTYTNTKSSEETTMYSGSVAGLPEDRESYSYKWCLTAYPYDLPVGDSTQRCMVIGYMCQPVGANYPPAPINNFRVETRKASQVTLKWDAPVTENIDRRGLPTGYLILRADSEDGEFYQLANISGRDILSYTDNEATESACVYQIVAYNTRESLPTTVSVPRLKYTDMDVKTQPTLSYTDGSELDLSSLVVTLTDENGDTKDLDFADFGEDFLMSLTEGSLLDLALDGSMLTVLYIPDGLITEVCALDIAPIAADGSNAPYDISLTASFTVGSTANATILEAGKAVSASATLKNNTAEALQLLVIIALYSDRGTMVASKSQAVSVEAGASSAASFSSAFTVPASVSGYFVKLFVWDGSSIADTRQIPKSNVVTLY